MAEKVMIEKSTTELITEIYNRPALWDRGSSHYHNRLATDTHWDEISVITGLSKERAKARWKRLRDIYRKELKKIIAIEERDGRSPDQPRWVHFTSMDFLRPTLSGDLKNGGPAVRKEPSLSDCSDDETKMQQEGGGHHHEHEHGAAVYSDHIRHHRENSLWSHRSLMEPTVEISTSGGGGGGGGAGRACHSDDDDRASVLRLVKRALKDEDDDDMHFLKSLAPYLKMLPSVKKLKLRNNIQLTILAGLDENADG